MQQLLKRLIPRRLTRYIFGECLHFFALCLTAFTGILFTIRILKFSSLIINKGVDPHQIGRVFLAVIPTFLEFALPLAALLGVMLAFARLSGDSEVVVLRASGVSLYQLLRPIALFGLMVFVFATIVSLYLKPWGHKTLSDSLFDIARSKSTAGLDAGTFNRVGALTIYAESISDASGALSGVMIDDRRGKDQRKVIFAERGRIVSHPSKRSIVFALHNGSIHEMLEGKYLATQFVSNSLVLSPDELYDPDAKQKGLAPRELRVSDLRSAIMHVRTAEQSMRLEGVTSRPAESFDTVVQSHFSETRLTLPQLTKKRRRLQVELDQRWAMPFAAAILAMLALPLGIHPPRAQRTWGAGLSVGVGMGVFVLYYGLLSLGLTMVEAGTLPSLVGVWLPNIISALVAGWLIQRFGSERWTSIADILTIVLDVADKLPRFRRADVNS